jgi:hypothetical protein
VVVLWEAGSAKAEAEGEVVAAVAVGALMVGRHPPWRWEIVNPRW